MKKLRTLIIALFCLTMIVAGCGNNNSGNGGNSSDSPSTATNAGASNEAASDYPNKSIELIIPYNPGGATDVIFRLVAKEMEKQLGQTIVPVNMGGASGTLGSLKVKDAKPDGYTIMGHHDAMATAFLSGVVDYSYEAFEPIALATQTPMAMAVHKDSGIKTLDDFVKYVKSNPGKAKWAIAPGETDHFFMAQLMKDKGITEDELQLVSYQGSQATAQAILSKEVTGGVMDVPTGKGYFADGTFNAIGLGYPERLETHFPNVATLKEQGLDLELNISRGLFAPKGTPPEIVKVLEDAVKKALESPELQKKIVEEQGSLVKFMPAEEYKGFVTTLQEQLSGRAELIK